MSGGMIYVEDEDGFLTPAFDKECVVVAEAGSQQSARRCDEAAMDIVSASSPAPVVPVPNVPDKPEENSKRHPKGRNLT